MNPTDEEIEAVAQALYALAVAARHRPRKWGEITPEARVSFRAQARVAIGAIDDFRRAGEPARARSLEGAAP